MRPGDTPYDNPTITNHIRTNIHDVLPHDNPTKHTNNVCGPSIATSMQPMLLNYTLSASGTSALLPISSLAKLVMLEMLPPKLSRSLQSDCFLMI